MWTAAIVTLPFLAVGAADEPGIITPGFTDVHWMDTDGKRIEAHAAGMLQSPVDNRWYWYGESQKNTNQSDHGINCYSAESLAGPWRNEGQALKQGDIHEPTLNSSTKIVERPKVIYNSATKMFVMWFHLDDVDYGYNHAGIATAPNATGPYSYVRSVRPHGRATLDMSLWRDPLDGQAYHIHAGRAHGEAGGGLYINRLTEDYLDIAGDDYVSKLGDPPKLEGMAMFRRADGSLWMMCSGQTGWNPNPLHLYRAKGERPQVAGATWESLGDPANDSKGLNSQPTYVVQYRPKCGDPYFIYMGDNWVNCPHDLINACYIWLPIDFNGDGSNATLTRVESWNLENPFPRKSNRDCGPATDGEGSAFEERSTSEGAIVAASSSSESAGYFV